MENRRSHPRVPIVLDAHLERKVGNGLVLNNISSFYQPVVTGSILLIAIVLDEIRRRTAESA